MNNMNNGDRFRGRWQIPSKSQVSAEANAWPDLELKANLQNVSRIWANERGIWGTHGNTWMDTKPKITKEGNRIEQEKDRKHWSQILSSDLFSNNSCTNVVNTLWNETLSLCERLRLHCIVLSLPRAPDCSPTISVQVQCWSRPKLVTSTRLFPLEVLTIQPTTAIPKHP